jgi:hypothetical protein
MFLLISPNNNYIDLHKRASNSLPKVRQGLYHQQFAHHRSYLRISHCGRVVSNAIRFGLQLVCRMFGRDNFLRVLCRQPRGKTSPNCRQFRCRENVPDTFNSPRNLKADPFPCSTVWDEAKVFGTRGRPFIRSDLLQLSQSCCWPGSGSGAPFL